MRSYLRLSLILSAAIGWSHVGGERLLADDQPPSETARLLTCWRKTKDLVHRGQVPDRQIREAAMVLVWGQFVEDLTVSADEDLVKQLKRHVRSAESARRKLTEAVAAYEAAGDSFAGKSGRFYSAYLSSLDTSGQLYVLHVPPGYDPERKYALEVQPAAYIRRYDALRRRKKPDGHLVLSLCGRGQNAIEVLGELDALEAIRDVRKHYSVDPDRIYLVGGSIGGGGVWRMAARYPDLFAAALVDYGWTCSSRLNLENVSALPMWVYHDDKDHLVPVDESRTAFRLLSPMGGPIIYTETSGGGHSGRKEDPAWDRKGWLFRQRRNACPVRICYTTETPARGRAYWLEILEFADPNALASIGARARRTGQTSHLFLHMQNIQCLGIDLPKKLFDPSKPLSVVAGGAPLTVSSPLPSRLFLHRSANATTAAPYVLAKTDPRKPKPFRPYVAGGLSSMYISGEPLMIVRGTHGDDPDMIAAVDRFCRMLSRRATAWWPSPMGTFDQGRIPVKTDVELTPDDVRRCNLILVGPASANEVLARITSRLPAVEKDNSLRIAGESYALKGRCYGLLHYNPEAPRRLVLVVSSPEATFFQTVKNGITDRMADERPLGLVIRQLDPPRRIREIAWGKDWRIPAGAFDTERLPEAPFADTISFRDAYVRAMCGATGADYAVYWDEARPAPFDVAHARWHDLKAAMGQRRVVYSALASGAKLRALLAANEAGKAHAALYPPVEENALTADTEYRVCLEPRMIKGYAHPTRSNLRDACAMRIDLAGEIRRQTQTPRPRRR